MSTNLTFNSGSLSISGDPDQLVDFIKALRKECEPSGVSADLIYLLETGLIEYGLNKSDVSIDEGQSPVFRPGASALFKTEQSDLRKYNGKVVLIKHLLTEQECDIPDVGFMYEVECEFVTFHAFEDELTSIFFTAEEMFEAVKEQLGDANGPGTEYGEPQAFVTLANGRYIEVTLEQEGLQKKDWFYSVRLHCNQREFDDGEYRGTCGIIDLYNTASGDVNEILSLLELALEFNESYPVKEGI